MSEPVLVMGGSSPPAGSSGPLGRIVTWPSSRSNP
jgi:hypothetical protein